MAIEADRIAADIAAISEFTQTPGRGISRPTFSAAWRQACDYIVAQAKQIGCRHRIDAAGNVHIRQTAIPWDSPAWLTGSFLDTAPNAGRFAGVTGIVAALEMLRSAKTDLKTSAPLELVIWAESEGSAFGQPLLGAQAHLGEVGADQLSQVKNADGKSYLEAGAEHGVSAQKLAEGAFRAASYVGVIEVKLEEIGWLFNTGLRVGFVTAVAGRRLSHCVVTGAGAHAGLRSMADRHDALAGAAEMILAIEKAAKDLGRETTAAVTQVAVSPGLEDHISDQVLFSVDFRSPSSTVMLKEYKVLPDRLADIAESRGLKVQHDIVLTQSPVETDSRIRGKMAKGADWRAVEQRAEVTFGKATELTLLAKHMPVAMILVAAQPESNHTPREMCHVQDIAAAAAILFETVKDRRLEK